LSNYLRAKAGLSPVAIGLVQEALHAGNTTPLPQLIKALPVRLDTPAPLARAISSAGGLRFAALDDRFMLRARPGVFAAGEMLDWEAPTGGYLLQGCFSSGSAAAGGIRDWLEHRK
jgi:predicted flavoprotein YhiN